jgi:hypothetical protein
MLVTPHAVMGATIGALIKSRPAAVPLAVASHFALDMVPHWQETVAPYRPHAGTWLRAPLDLALAAGMTAFIARRSDDPGAVWRAACAAASPDLDFVLFAFPALAPAKGPVQVYVTWHSRIQRETASLWGLAPQVGVVVGCLWLTRASSHPPGPLLP